jgi:hypothetical protein
MCVSGAIKRSNSIGMLALFMLFLLGSSIFIAFLFGSRLLLFLNAVGVLSCLEFFSLSDESHWKGDFRFCCTVIAVYNFLASSEVCQCCFDLFSLIYARIYLLLG